MQTVSVNGTTRYFVDEGEGPAVILIHGSMSNSRQWKSLIDCLRGRFRLLAPDLYACTQEEGAARLGEFTFEEDCALVMRLIDMAGKAHVVGHSYGGVVAIKAAFERRDALTSLVLIEPSCFHLLDPAGPEYAEIIALQAQTRVGAAANDFDAIAHGFIDYWMGPETWPAMPQRRRETIALGVPKLAHDWHGTLAPFTRLADYRLFTPPTLLIRAKDTKRPSARIFDLLADALPNRTLIEIGHGGHMSPLTNPEPVNAAVAAFLDGGIRPTG
jgi:pimeloyl-ACP methyl ester carboxylesterase